MADESFDLKGLDGLLKKFHSLDSKIQKRLGWGAVRKGALVIRDQAVRNARRIDKPKRPQDKVDSSIAPFIAYQRGSIITNRHPEWLAYRIGVKGGAKYSTRVPPTYWRYVEFGTSKTRAQPFMRPAMRSTMHTVADTIGRELWKRVEKEVKKK